MATEKVYNNGAWESTADRTVTNYTSSSGGVSIPAATFTRIKQITGLATGTYLVCWDSNFAPSSSNASGRFIMQFGQDNNANYAWTSMWYEGSNTRHQSISFPIRVTSGELNFDFWAAHAGSISAWRIALIPLGD